jgi:hypothetical protein
MNPFEGQNSAEHSPSEEEIQAVLKQKKENAEMVMEAALKVAQEMLSEIDPDLSAELIPGMDINGKPDVGIFYKKGERYGGLITKDPGPNLTNEGATYRPGGASADIENGTYAHNLRQIIEDEMTKQNLGKYKRGESVTH